MPDDPSRALEILEAYYNSDADFALHELASECASKFRQHAEIMNYVFMAQVNLAMDGGLVAPEQLRQAVDFWESPAARSRWSRSSLLYNQGNAFKALNSTSEAVAKYRESLAVNPNFAPCWKNLGAIYFATEHFDIGRQCYEEAIRYDPGLFEALYALGVYSYQREHDTDKAVMYFDRIDLTKLLPLHIASVCGWKANCFLKIGRYGQGIENAERAIAAFPEMHWGWKVAARLYALARRENKEWLKPAFSFWQRFVSRHYDSAEGWAELGFVCWFLRDAGDKDQISKLARTAFERAVKLDKSHDGLIWDRIGHLYQEDGNWIEAERAYRKAAEIDSAQFGYCLGVSLLKLDRYSEAVPLLLAAAQNHQPDAMSWSQVALCYDKLGDENKAAAAYLKAIELDPNYAQVWFDLGGYFWNHKEIGLAIKVWKEAMVRFPDDKNCAHVRVFLKKTGVDREK